MAANKTKGKWQQWENVKEALVTLESKLGHFPTQRELADNGLAGVATAITRDYGSINEVAKKLGKISAQRTRGYWKKEENVVNEFNTVVVQLGHIPNYTELKEINNALLSSVEKHYAGYNNFLKKQGLELSRKEEFYWASIDNTIAEARRLMEEHNLESFPNANILQELNATSLNHAIHKYHGGFRKFRLLLGEKPPRIKMGQWKEIDYCIAEAQRIKNELQVDFLPGAQELRKKGYSSFTHAIHKYHGGLGKFREILGEGRLKNQNGIWKDESYTIAQAERFMKENKYTELPSSATLQEKGAGSLLSGIKKYHRGIESFRRKLEERKQVNNPRSLEAFLEAYVDGTEIPHVNGEANKPASYWSDWNNVQTVLAELIEKHGSIPSYKKLKALNQGTLAWAIDHYHGGFPAVREKMGCTEIKKPSRYWEQWKNVKKELEQIMGEIEHFPSSSEIKGCGLSTLNLAINAFGGVNAVRKKLGYEPLESTMQQYKKWSAIQEVLEPIIQELGVFPSAQVSRNRGLGEVVCALYEYHGGINTARKKLGKEIEKCKYAEKTGLINGLEEMWQKHPELKGEIPPDNWMRENGFNELGYAICRYHGGFGNIREQLGKKPRHKYKRGDLQKWNNLVSEIIKINDQHPELQGELPSLNWLHDHGYVAIGHAIIKYHEGFRAAREKLGQEQHRVENGYYKDFENIKRDLEKLREELGYFPSVRDMQKKGNASLYYGITRYHKGIRAVREKLGESLKTKENGYWQEWENVEQELIPIISDYGYIPGAWTLNKIGKKSLCAAITKYYGGMREVREKMQGNLPNNSQENLESFLTEYVGGETHD